MSPSKSERRPAKCIMYYRIHTEKKIQNFLPARVYYILIFVFAHQEFPQHEIIKLTIY